MGFSGCSGDLPPAMDGNLARLSKKLSLASPELPHHIKDPNAPKDRFNLVLIVVSIMGLMSMLPASYFTTANEVIRLTFHDNLQLTLLFTVLDVQIQERVPKHDKRRRTDLFTEKFRFFDWYLQLNSLNFHQFVIHLCRPQNITKTTYFVVDVVAYRRFRIFGGVCLHRY